MNVEKRVICHHCKEENKKSRVIELSRISTLLHSPMTYDEEGILINTHDPNIITINYQCSNGHAFSIEEK